VEPLIDFRYLIPWLVNNWVGTRGEVFNRKELLTIFITFYLPKSIIKQGFHWENGKSFKTFNWEEKNSPPFSRGGLTLLSLLGLNYLGEMDSRKLAALNLGWIGGVPTPSSFPGTFGRHPP